MTFGVSGVIYDPVSQGLPLFDLTLEYFKGAYVLHMLRFVLGDSTFYGSLSAYRTRFSFGSAITTDFEGAVESFLRRDLRWFFHEWSIQRAAHSTRSL